jgi:hypothetical protein
LPLAASLPDVYCPHAASTCELEVVTKAIDPLLSVPALLPRTVCETMKVFSA